MRLAPSDKVIVHLDMNSYFASVEQQANVELRGRALGVCAYLHPRGCVIAASIEAKRCGMKVGMSVEEAKSKVPSAVFVQNDPAKYRAVTSRVFSILHELTDKIEHYSIDEAFLDLTGWYRDAAEAAWAMTKVRRRITVEVGDWLRCSIGIAPTRFLAKTASDMEKPNGLVIIDYQNLDEMLSRLDLEDVCGIGPHIRKRLERLGMHTLIDVKRYPVANLMHHFGKYGYFLHAKLHGFDVEQLQQAGETLPKSIGHSYCVPMRVNREGRVPSVLMKLTERAGRRLRALEMLTGTVHVSVGLRPRSYVGAGLAPALRGMSAEQGDRKGRPYIEPITSSFWRPEEGLSDFTHLPEPAADSFTLTGAAQELLRSMWHGQPVNFLAVTLCDLSVPTGQARLDDMGDSWLDRRDRRVRASSAVDAIRDRYGDSSISFGTMMETDDEAPDRIGFRKVEGVEIERLF